MERDVWFKAVVTDPHYVGGGEYLKKGDVVTIIKEAKSSGMLHWRPLEFPAITWWYAHNFRRLSFTDYYKQLLK